MIMQQPQQQHDDTVIIDQERNFCPQPTPKNDQHHQQHSSIYKVIDGAPFNGRIVAANAYNPAVNDQKQQQHQQCHKPAIIPVSIHQQQPADLTHIVSTNGITAGKFTHDNVGTVGLGCELQQHQQQQQFERVVHNSSGNLLSDHF